MSGAIQESLGLIIQCAYTRRVRKLHVALLAFQELLIRYFKGYVYTTIWKKILSCFLSQKLLMFNYFLKAMKDAIVSKHNDLRSKVANGLEVLGVDGTQPKAANMRELVWNDELAEVAQRYPTMITLHSLFLFY